MPNFPTPDYAGSKKVYVPMGVVKYIKSVVFLLDNYIARKNPTTNFLAIPLQAWRGPEGSRRLRLPDFKTIGT